jgi:hypothetical protein
MAVDDVVDLPQIRWDTCLKIFKLVEGFLGSWQSVVPISSSNTPLNHANDSTWPICTLKSCATWMLFNANEHITEVMRHRPGIDRHKIRHSESQEFLSKLLALSKKNVEIYS